MIGRAALGLAAWRRRIVHAQLYSGTELAAIQSAMRAAGMVELGRYGDLLGTAALYEAR